MSDDTASNETGGGSKLSNLRAMFDKNPPKIKKPQQYQHGKGHALNNLASPDQEPINPLGKDVNPNSNINDVIGYNPTKRNSLPISPSKEMKTWNPQARRGSDRPLFAHDQRPINPFGKDVNPNANAAELLEERVKASQDYEDKVAKAVDSGNVDKNSEAVVAAVDAGVDADKKEGQEEE